MDIIQKPALSNLLWLCLLTLEHVVEAQRPGFPPTPAPEEEEVEDIGALKRFLHKLGVDLDPSDLIVGFIVLSVVAVAGWYFWKMKKTMKLRRQLISQQVARQKTRIKS